MGRKKIGESLTENQIIERILGHLSGAGEDHNNPVDEWLKGKNYMGKIVRIVGQRSTKVDFLIKRLILSGNIVMVTVAPAKYKKLHKIRTHAYGDKSGIKAYYYITEKGLKTLDFNREYIDNIS